MPSGKHKNHAKGRKTPAARLPEGAEMDAWITDTINRYVAESPLQSDATKTTFAVTMRALLEEQEFLRACRRATTITTDQEKCVSTVASNIRRTIEALGLVAHKEEEIDL